MPGWNSTHMVGNPTTLQRARQGGWNSNHLPYCLLCGCLIKKLQTLRFTCRPIQESDHLVVGKVTSPAQQMVISINTFWLIPEKKLFKVYHYQSQHSTQISPVIWRETSGSKLEKQILATKSHSSNDLFSSVVLLLQVIFFQSFSMFVTFRSSYLSIIFHSLASLFLITQHLRLISFIVAWIDSPFSSTL